MQEALEEMRSASGLAAKQLERRELDRTSAFDQVADLKEALEKSWTEITDLRKQNGILIQKHKTDTELREQQLKVEYHKLLTDQIRADTKKEEELKATISSLRESLGQRRDINSSRAENYESEIQQLIKKIQLLDQANSDLTIAQAETARPLLRQITDLENQLKANQITYTTLERSLRSRIGDEESMAIEAKGQLAETRDQLQNYQTKHKTLNVSMRTVNSNLQELQKKLAGKVQKYKSIKAAMEQQKQEMSEMENSHQITLKQLTERLDRKSTTLEQTKSTLNSLQTEVSSLRKQNSELSGNKISTPSHPGSPPPVTVLSNPSSPPPSVPVPALVPVTIWQNPSSQSTSLAMQKLLLSLEQKSGEVSSLESTNKSLNHTKSELENELVVLTTKNDDLQKKVEQMMESEKENKVLKERFLASLELLGERAERASELTNDINDFKQLYKQQINLLCGQIEVLTKENLELRKKL